MEGVGERFARDAKTGESYTVPKDMTYKEWCKRFVVNEDNEQNFKLVVKNDKDSVTAKRHNTTIKATRLVNTKNKMYVSDKVTLKPKQQHIIDKNVSLAKTHFSLNGKTEPTIIIADPSELGNSTLASYNAVDNTMKISSCLGIKEKTFALQKDGVLPHNEISTIVHEFVHWDDAMRYSREVEAITADSYQRYMNYLNKNAKAELDKLEKSGYNINVSAYAWSCLDDFDFNETRTEIIVLRKLGE